MEKTVEPKETILIVDDNQENLRVLRKVLKLREYKVNLASSAEMAYQSIENSIPNLIMLDINMPNINGYEACETLKKKYNLIDVPIIFISANTDTLAKVKAFESGGVDYVSKPFAELEVLARVKVHLDLQEAKNKLKEQAMTDSLTGVFNRRYMLEKLKNIVSLAKRHEFPVSIIMSDVDRFKSINDNYGHQIGDEVLINLAKVIKENLRESDVLSRWGGEEFLVMLPHTNLDGAKIVGEKIREMIQGCSWSESTLKVTVSSGVSEYSSESIDQFINRADALLYEAKKSGRNCLKS